MKAQSKVAKLPQKERKRQAIVEAATNVFLHKGYAITSMDEIAAEAGVSKRTVYDHFENKENLFQTILVDHWSAVFKINQPLFKNSKNSTDSLIEFAKKFFDFLYQPKTIKLFRLLISESERFPHLLDTLLVDEKAPFTKELIIFLEHRKNEGKFKGKNVETAAAFFIGMLKEVHYWPMMLGFTKSKKPKNQFLNEAVEIFVRAYF